MTPSRTRTKHVLAAALTFAASALGNVGCNRVPPSAFATRDSGPPPGPVDQAIVNDRVARYVSVAGRQGAERCRCAIDYEYCRFQLDADWDASGESCLGDVVREDVAGFTSALSCLENEVGTFETCHEAFTCTDAAHRQACVDAWTSAGSDCLAQMSGTAQVSLASCQATAPDAGP